MTNKTEPIYIVKNSTVYHKRQNCPALTRRGLKPEPLPITPDRLVGYRPCWICAIEP